MNGSKMAALLREELEYLESRNATASDVRRFARAEAMFEAARSLDEMPRDTISLAMSLTPSGPNRFHVLPGDLIASGTDDLFTLERTPVGTIDGVRRLLRRASVVGIERAAYREVLAAAKRWKKRARVAREGVSR